ncbi:MAG: hypothetical protein Fur006_54870 [Coleofasciculaceae cyanobacterium]
MNATNEDSCFLTRLDSFVAKLKLFNIILIGFPQVDISEIVFFVIKEYKSVFLPKEYEFNTRTH